VIADLDTLLIALYVELTDRIIPSLGLARSGPGQRPQPQGLCVVGNGALSSQACPTRRDRRDMGAGTAWQ